MATKAELEVHYSKYRSAWAEVQRAAKAGDDMSAIQHALFSLDSASGYVDFEAKFNKQPVIGIPTVTFLCETCPAFFRFKELEQVRNFLESQTRILKKLGWDPWLDLHLAESNLKLARKLWDQLVKNSTPVIKANDGSASILQKWAALGITLWNSSETSLPQRFCAGFHRSFVALCPECGAKVTARKLQFSGNLPCSKCNEIVDWVFICDTSSETI